MNEPKHVESSLTPLTKKNRNHCSLRSFDVGRHACSLVVAVVLVLLLPAIGASSASSTQTVASADNSKSNAGDSPQTHKSPNRFYDVNFRNTDLGVKYVGSKACENCHEPEYQKFLRTPHGQSATTPEGRLELENLPSEGVTVCQSDKQTCFRVFRAKGGFYMSQFIWSGGLKSHAEVERIAFALGTPLFATGYLVQRGNYLFEAPLTYYTGPTEGHVQGWGISPGYGNDSVGFTRPVVGSCLTCHVGRLGPVDAASNRYSSPPFEELSIGCESCHGPGATHVTERQDKQHTIETPQGVDTSIVNPKHLTSQLADETCMYCHELGQARVPLPGKSFQDYRPGVPLLRTQAIFKSKLLLGWNLEEWSDEMATSACFRFSNGAMRCSTCHDPHSTPTKEEAPEFYRSKCLTCHQTSSCSLPLIKRQHTQPEDNCISCHMPEHVAPKLVKVGGRGTSHRITRNDGEAVPPMNTPQTTPDPATGLILVDSDSVDSDSKGGHVSLPKSVLLSAYQGVLVRDHSSAELIERYRTVLEDLKGNQSTPIVLSALAGAALAEGTPEGDRQAIKDLSKGLELDSKSPKDYLLLAELQERGGDSNAAIKVLSLAIERFPYLPAPYESLVTSYTKAGDTAKASEALHRGLELFPSDKKLLELAAKVVHP